MMKSGIKARAEIIFQIFKTHLKYNVLIVLLSLVTLAITYTSPLVNAFIVDDAIDGMNMKLLVIGVAGYFGISLLNGIVSFITSTVNIKYQYDIEKDVKNRILKYYLDCRRTDISETSSGEVTTIIRNDAAKFIRLISGSIWKEAIAVAKLIVATILLMKLQPVLGILIMLHQVMVVFFKQMFNKKLAENSNELRQGFISVVDRLNEIAFNIRKVTLIKADSYLLRRYNEAYDGLYISNKRSNKLFQCTILISELLDVSVTCVILGLGGYFVMKGNMTVGILFSFMSYVSMFGQTIYELCEMPTQYYNDKKSIDSVFEILIKQQEKGEQIINFETDRKVDKIVIDNISFKYDSENEIYKNANVVFYKTKNNYIVGKSGIGKSTLIKLIMGDYMPDAGNIMFDDMDIGRINADGEIQNYISWVPQEPILFNDTIRNNIVLDSEVADEELVDVCKSCVIFEDIERLNSGFDTMLNECGNNLSTGQKHRIGLARALLQKQPVIIIDEGTAGLDDYTEKVVKENIQRFFKDKLVIIITHSMDFIVENACVYEIKNKKIKELKRHEYNRVKECM